MATILVCEYVTGGGIADPTLPGALLDEAERMVHAVVADLRAMEGVRVLLCRDRRLPAPEGLDGIDIVPVEAAAAPDAWTAAALRSTAVWPIAPETGGALERLAALFRATGRPVVACDAGALAIASSKRATATRLLAAGIAAVPAYGPRDPLPPAGAYVVKPDDGAGTVDTYILPDAAAVAAWFARHSAGGRGADRRGADRRGADRRWIAQPLIEGEPASFSMLCRAGGTAMLLACNLQKVRRRKAGRRCDRFDFETVEVGALEARRAAWSGLAAAVAAAVPGLRGYVGVDLIDRADGPCILEINPRLTTGYVGLRDFLGINVAERVLEEFIVAPGVYEDISLRRPAR